MHRQPKPIGIDDDEQHAASVDDFTDDGIGAENHAGEWSANRQQICGSRLLVESGVRPNPITIAPLTTGVDAQRRRLARDIRTASRPNNGE